MDSSCPSSAIQKVVFYKLPALTNSFALHGCFLRNSLWLDFEHIEFSSSKIQGLCPTPDAECAQQDLKLHNVMIGVSMTINVSYVVKKVVSVCE